MTAILLVSKVTLVLVIALGLDLALRRKAVLACAAMWNAALLSLALIPAAAFLLPGLPLPLIGGDAFQVPAEPAANAVSPTSVDEHVPSQRTTAAPNSVDAPLPAAPSTFSLPPLAWSLAVLYFAGVGIALMRFATSLAAIRNLRSRSDPLTCPVWQARLANWTSRLHCGPVELRQSDSIDVPLMLGWLRPVIVVPRTIAESAELDRCDAVLVHELAHVLRGDYAWQLLLRLVQAALWLHPLMWLAARRMQFIRERACDEFSVYALGDSQTYGNVLLEIASRQTRRPALGLALGFLRTPQIVSRIEELAASAGNPRCTVPARHWWPALLICLCVSGVVGTVHLVSAQPPEKKAPSAPKEPVADDPAKKAGQAKPAPRTVQVTVADADGKPLAGAKIHVSVWTKEPGYGNRDFICDEEGKAKLELPKQIQILRLWALHKGHVAMFAQWWPETESKPRDIPTEYAFQLEKGTKIGGVVKNEDGEPITGAKVEARLVGLHGEAEAAALALRAIPNIWLAEKEDVKTDAAGRWSLDNVPAADDAEVLVLLGHPDYVSESRWGGLQKEQEVAMRSLRDGSATIVMQRGLIVSGVVANADGKPLGDALVVRGDDPYFEHGSQEVRTHADGSYQLPPQLAGPLTLTVVAPGWAPDQRKLDVAPDKLQADFEFQRGNTIRIHITDESGVAIPEVFVGLARWRGNRGLYNAVHPNVLPTKIPNQSDENGVYEWTWSPVDDVSYGFYKEGYLEAELVAGPGEHFVKLRKR